MVSVAALLVAGTLFVYLVLQRRRRSKLPPGPPALPLIGNLHQAPTEAVWLTFQEWVKQYGNLVSVNFGGTTIIIIGDYDTAKDLLDKRANIYSGRPRMVMLQELVCKNNHIAFKPFDEEYLQHQRLEASVLSPRASACYTPIQDLESKQLLKDMLDSSNCFHNIERYAASLAYSMSYGMRILTGDEWQIRKSQACIANFEIAGQVGVWIVDALPWLNYLPAPLAPWKKTAATWFQMWDSLHQTNLRDAQKREGWNWAKDFVAAKEFQSMTEEQIAWDVGILCDAGVETLSTTLQIFILACVAHPEWIPRAQKELDEVIGRDRLPEFDDMRNLPYIQAVVEENFRWRHALPLGTPHATTRADHYKGYLIPEGSIIIPLFNAMRKDDHIFDAPSVFRPERWLGKSQSGSFGYGRRICTGRHIARNSLNIAVARLLWAFDIRAQDGRELVVEESMFTTGFVSVPKNVEATFAPRSESRARVIQDALGAAEKDVTQLLSSVREKQVAAGIKPWA
ncbi:cytochrome P450 [Decorospora gaudefroyi]|uniref:Cytochrome P450 n=1 Tax=Decorospora gaudefroyi TaxID=184978 RepID=A0A6A5KEJ7_9PLEO|nr:cytochrome P450 [Decorospora gaudefroyi]